MHQTFIALFIDKEGRTIDFERFSYKRLDTVKKAIHKLLDNSLYMALNKDAIRADIYETEYSTEGLEPVASIEIAPKEDNKPNKYLQALKAGREIVIVSANENDDSAIFYMVNGNVYSFGRSLEIIKRNKTDQELAMHFERMEREGAHLFIRGWSD